MKVRIMQRDLATYFLLFLATSCSHLIAAVESETIWDQYKLWYAQPASEWNEALPVGNGRLGAMVFGGIMAERIQLNDDTVWVGPPVPKNRQGAAKYIAQARELIFKGKYIEAQRLVQKNVMGKRISPRSYQTLGELHLHFLAFSSNVDDSTGIKSGKSSPVLKAVAQSPQTMAEKKYRRQLDLDTAIATTTFQLEGITYTREVFSSAVDDVIVIRVTADKPRAVSLRALLNRPGDFTTSVSNSDTIDMFGQAQHNGKHLGVKWNCRLKVVPDGGKLKTEGGAIIIEKADSVILCITSSTNYNKDNPASPLTHDRKVHCGSVIKSAMEKSYEQLRQRHVAEHHGLFRRCRLDLGSWDKSIMATDERLKAVKSGGVDPALVSLYFQYGRYLLIGSSRPGAMPANLQGIWNPHLKAPWNSDYHININMQMNYWPAEVTNLSECHEPFFDFTERLVPSGRKTSREVFGCSGFTAGHATDVWLWTSVYGNVQYGMWPMGAAWNTQHFMEHYRYTGDVEFLSNRAYPILKESAKFFLDYLIEDPRIGKLVAGPSTSPENRFLTPDGKRATLDVGTSMDQEIIWDNFTNYLEAAAVLGIEDEFVKKVRATRCRLALPGIGSDGRLMEWTQEFKEPEPGHRHISHLYALHPGRQYNFYDSPEMVEAARKTLDYRLSHGGGHTGWSRAWIINFWARFHDAQKAHRNLLALLRKSTLPNLLDTHPPFQIDGNFGATAGIAEMLLQSHVGDSKKGYLIELLPACPKAWPNGTIMGLRARDGYEIDIEWQNGKLKRAVLNSLCGKSCRVRYGGKTLEIKLDKGKKRVLSANDFK